MKLNEGSGPAYVVILGRFMTNIGFFMVIPFLTIYVTQDAGMSGLQAGALFAVLEFTRRGLGMPAGWASDRVGAARVLVLGLLIEVVGYLAFTVAGRSFLVWVAAVALLGIGGVLNNNGSRSLLAATGAAGAATNLSRYYVSINGAALIGPLIGTLLLATGSVRLGFVVSAGLHLLFATASAVLLRGMARPGSSAIRVADVTIALRDRYLMSYCALAVGGWFLITQYRIALPLTVVHQKLSGDLVGLLTAANAVAVMVAVWLIGSRVERRGTLGRLDLFGVSGLVLAGGWMLCVFTGVPILVVSVIVTSVGESIFCGVVDALVAAMAPPGRLGLYLGYSTMAWGVGGVLAGFSGGGFDLAAGHGALPLFWAGLALVGILAAAGTLVGRRQFAAEIDRRMAAVQLSTG
jgi:MFS transporter, DHA1 family, multidrug resistance protein